MKHHKEQKDRRFVTCRDHPVKTSRTLRSLITEFRDVPAASPQPLQDTNAPVAKLGLAPFPDSQEAEDDLRDFALAWESLANSGMSAARLQAYSMLKRSAVRYPNDPATLAALGYEEQVHGDIGGARVFYQRALAADPNSIDAATNVGVIEAQNGNLSEAVKLLQSAFDLAPGRSTIGMDLARVFCFEGKLDESRAVVERVREFNPDMGAAKSCRTDCISLSQIAVCE